MPQLGMDVQVRRLPLRDTFRIARATWEHTDNVFIRLRHGDQAGWGEASPDAHWGESVESVSSQLHDADLARLNGPLDLEGIDELLPAGSARCALDIAAHDLAARLAGLRLDTFLGLEGRSLPATSVTLPIAEVAAMVEKARSYADHPILKMKVGFDGDVEAVAAVREVFRGVLRIDANEGWDVNTAVDRLQALEAYDIELCEQPITTGDLGSLSKITESTSIPIFADEDVCTSRDVVRLAGVVDGVNLKLRKTGGIREALRAIAVARAHGSKVMLGCDLHSGVATAAGAHLGSLVDHLDMDGSLLLADDPFPGVRYERGQISLAGKIGLGVTEAA
jgi:L-alanine-DL-glutamate epimerase-like enolase superfamily enzyme